MKITIYKLKSMLKLLKAIAIFLVVFVSLICFNKSSFASNIHYVNTKIFSNYTIANNDNDEFGDSSDEFGDSSNSSDSGSDIDLIKDPWEKFNRKSFNITEWADKHVISHVSKVYKYIPGILKLVIYDVNLNISEPLITINDILQFRLLSASSSAARFLLNSTLGFLGVFNVADALGMPQQSNDLGYTLSYYKIKRGPYLFIPFLGPNTVSSFSALTLQSFIYSKPVVNLLSVNYWDVISIRLAGELNGYLLYRGYYNNIIKSSVDPYDFIKSAYIQNRNYNLKKIHETW